MTTQTQLIAQLHATVVQQGAVVLQVQALLDTQAALQAALADAEARLEAAGSGGALADPATAEVLPELADLVTQMGTQTQALAALLSGGQLPGGDTLAAPL